ncbi:MAG: DUF4199 domain-containing protein [Bacteroidia bacterium]
MRKIIWISGSIAGAIMIFSWFIMGMVWQSEDGTFDFDKGEVIGYTAMLLALSTVFLGIKVYRDRHLDGIISFKTAFLTGLYIVLVASGIYVVGWMVYYPNFMPDFADKYQKHQVEKLDAEPDLTEEEKQEQIAEMEEWMEMYKNPFVMAGFTFLEIFPIGLVVAILSALILKRKPQPAT